MTREIPALKEEDELALATQLMLWTGVRHLPVLREGELVGLVGERDALAYRASVGEREAALHPVRSVMRTPPDFADADEDLTAATDRMRERNIGALPVLEDGRLVGMLTATDLLRREAKLEREREMARAHREGHRYATVAEVMHAPVTTVRPDDHLLDAAARMRDLGVRHLPVVDVESRVLGMLSDRSIRTAIGDLWRAIDEEGVRARVRSMRVQAAMSSPAVTVTTDTPIGVAAAYFIDRRIGALPVVGAGGQLVGIVSYVDLLRVLRS